jgi:hypothetical protein
MTWQQMHDEFNKWADAPLRQIQLELAARQFDATDSISASTRRLEIATWILVGASAVLLVVTVVLLVVTAHWW